MFQFTEPTDAHDGEAVKLLHKWQGWLAGRGIRSEIRNHAGKVSLWRDGEPHVWPKCKKPGCPCHEWVGPPMQRKMRKRFVA